MKHRERRNFRDKKTRTEPLGHPIHGETSMFNSMNCLILKVRGIHALKPFPSVPAALDQGHAWSKLKKFPPQVTNTGTWPDHPMGTETGRWQKQKFKQKRQAVSRQLQPFSELGRHPIWKRHGTLVGSGFLAWLRGGSWGWAGWAVDILDTGRFLVDSGCTGRTTSKQLSKLYVCVGSSPSLQQGVNVPQ